MEEDKKTKRIKIDEDSISMLPDEIIEVILSPLTITEATRTSILSSRRRHLWRYFGGILDLDGFLITDFLRNIPTYQKVKSIPKKDKFIRWVNQVIKSNQSATLGGLGIRFDMSDHSSEVDGWVQYAIQKKVKKLELDLRSYPVPAYIDPRYVVDDLLLHFTSLISLHLKYVNVSGESLEHLLSSCQCLEELSVEYLKSLRSLKVSMPSSKLKRLEIINCNNLETLELNLKSLVHLSCSDIKI